MSAEELLRRWAAAKLGIPVEQIFSVEFVHEDGWSSDAGTWWPEENYAKVRLTRSGNPAVHTIAFDTVPELLQEVLDHA